MYKIIIMAKKSADEELINNFEKNSLIHIETAANKKAMVGLIDAAELNEEPYNKIYELEFATKHEMDLALASAEGKKFSRSVPSFFQHISVFFTEYK